MAEENKTPPVLPLGTGLESQPLGPRLLLGNEAVPVEFGLPLPTARRILRAAEPKQLESLSEILGQVRFDASRLPPHAWQALHAVSDLTVKSEKGERKWTLKLGALGILALGAFVLMCASGLAALATVVYMGRGSIPSSDGVRLVIGCVGGGAIGGVIAAFISKKERATSR